MLGRTKVGFCPLQAVSLLSKVGTVAFCNGSVAGRLKSPPLLIRGKNIAVRAYLKWYGSTPRRSICCDWGTERHGLNTVRIAEALGRNTAEGLTLRIDSITSELPVIRS